MTGTPWAWAMSEMALRSATLPAGLPMDSQNTALVLASMFAAMASMSFGATRRTSMPSRGRVCANRL
jgi:hypothetical protein